MRGARSGPLPPDQRTRAMVVFRMCARRTVWPWTRMGMAVYWNILRSQNGSCQYSACTAADYRRRKLRTGLVSALKLCTATSNAPCARSMWRIAANCSITVTGTMCCDASRRRSLPASGRVRGSTDDGDLRVVMLACTLLAADRFGNRAVRRAGIRLAYSRRRGGAVGRDGGGYRPACGGQRATGGHVVRGVPVAGRVVDVPERGDCPAVGRAVVPAHGVGHCVDGGLPWRRGLCNCAA